MSTKIIAKCREKQFQILCAVKDICDRAGIRMVLLGDAALAAYRGHLDVDNIDICIDAADIWRFMDALDKAQVGYTADSMYTNGDFPAFEMRIYDPETIDYDNKDFMKYRLNCLYVRVLFALHVPALKIRRITLNSLKNAYEIRNKVRFGERDESASRMVRIVEKQERKKGKDATAKWAFKKLVDGYANGSDKIVIGENAFKAGVIGKGKKVKINGTELLIPEQASRYFTRVFGRKWESYEIPEYAESVRGFRDADHSWAEFRERISYMDLDGYYEDLKKYQSGHRAFRAYHDDVNKYRRILTRTDMRFKLWQKYMPMKDEIVRLHEKGDYDALGELLKEYMHCMELCEKDKLGLCFDEDILNITLDVYRHQGEADHAAVLDSLVPAEHREVLKLMDYKGEIIK